MSSDGIKEHAVDRGLPGNNGANSAQPATPAQDPDQGETQDWLDALDAVVYIDGRDRASHLLHQIRNKAERAGVVIPFSANTPYINTIPADRQPDFPGDRELERTIKSMVRWNAM